MTAGPGARPQAQSGGFYLWRPPDHATASVAVQSRWGNLYDAPAAIRSLAVDVSRQAQVHGDIVVPADVAPVADRLPGPSLRLRLLNLPIPPFCGHCRVLLSLGEVTDLVRAHVALTPLRHFGDGMHVRITAVAPGAVFGLAQSQAGRPPNAVKRAARTIRLLVEATAVEVIR